MANLIVRELMSGDVDYVAANLREPDRRELLALGRTDAKTAIATGVLLSTHCWAAAVGDEPAVIFGVTPVSLLEGVGCPWMLATERAFNYPRVLVREGRYYARRMLDVYSRLVNHVDARNDRSVRWLRHIGFKIHPPVPLGELGFLFHPFEMAV